MSGTVPRLALILAFGPWVAACGEPATCAERELPFERDKCLHDEILVLPVERSEEVLAKAREIEDPIIRGAAVSSWVADHANGIPRATGESLCLLLDGRDRSYCQRRLTSPHLQR